MGMNGGSANVGNVKKINHKYKINTLIHLLGNKGLLHELKQELIFAFNSIENRLIKWLDNIQDLEKYDLKK